MKISDIEIRSCKRRTASSPDLQLRDSFDLDLHYLVVSACTDNGLRADTFGFAGRSAEGAAHIAASFLKPMMIGRDPAYREKLWVDFRDANRMWHHTPIFTYGPFDSLCWLLCALHAGEPLYRYIGAVRNRVPSYASSMYFDSPEEYAAEALKVKTDGWKGYKLHPPKDFNRCMAAHELCREAVGPDFRLMSDPVGNFSLNDTKRLLKRLEELDYYWLEEPLYDEFTPALRDLTRSSKIPIVSGECIAQRPYSVADSIASRSFDIERADVSWSGGVTGVLKTAHLAEAFGMQCEIHTAVFEPLELLNLHCCAALNNCEMFEVLYPRDRFAFGLQGSIEIADGMASLPENPGLGSELDWDLIENDTVSVY